MKKTLFQVGALMILSFASAQTDLIRNGSIGSTVDPAKSCEFSPKNSPPVTCWVGQKMIFLPAPKSSQQYGYQSFKGGTGRFGSVSYEEGVGKIATITSIGKNSIGSYNITVRVDSTGSIYTADSSTSDPSLASINGVAFVREIQAARTNLKGKTLWLTSDNVATYDDSTGKINTIYIKKFQPVKVEDVVAGWYNHSPVHLIIRLPDGRQAFASASYYGWNAGTLRERFAFSREYFLQDPRITHKWPAKIWSALEDDKIIPGMTKEQVYFSRSQGYSVNKSTTSQGDIEQWTYQKYGIVTFINGVVTSFTELNN